MNMFFPVRVYNKDGKLKKQISVRTLKKRHWKHFDEDKTMLTEADKEVEQNSFIVGFEREHGYN